MSNLANGQYTIRAIDQAGNYSSGEVIIDTSAPNLPVITAESGAPLGGVVSSTANPNVTCTDADSGICAIVHQPPSGPASTRAFSGAATQFWGPFTGLAQGSHTFKTINCAGSISSTTIYYADLGAASMQICSSSGSVTRCDVPSPAPSAGQIADGWRFRIGVQCANACGVGDLQNYAYLTVDGADYNGNDSTALWYETLPARTLPFKLTRMTSTAPDPAMSFMPYVELKSGANTYLGQGTSYSASQIPYGGSIVGTVTVQDSGQSVTASTASFTFVSRIANLGASVMQCAEHVLQAARQGLAQFGGCRGLFGSEFYLNLAGTMTYTATDPGGLPTVDTTTAKLYGWAGSSWTLSGIDQLGASKSTTTGVVTASATTRTSGLYAVLFSVTDASAPTTSWSIQGSSSGFAGTAFLSTYSYLVLSSTDPVVNGFASGLATTYYRVDGLPGDAFAAYSSSLSFLPGTHWVDYYAVDWAGNQEPVKRATVTVTAGSVTRLSGDLQVDGNLLVGFMGSGARAEVVARAEYDYALMVSSVDRRAMLAVDNANFVSLGTAPASGRLTLAGVPGDTALALRSGNSTASVAGAQFTFGFDGTGDLRHRLYTQHGPEPYQNKAVFALWTPASGSSSTLGALPVLSLEGSTHTAAQALVHVMPAGLADKELVVSDGASMGMGSVLRGERWTPSSAALKKDVKRLGRAEEDKAWDEVAALRPVRFRRLGADAPVERGYVYEETPESIRDGPGAVSADERLVNAELALKAAMRRIEELKTRIKKLKEAER